jgi:hypothetical protein
VWSLADSASLFAPELQRPDRNVLSLRLGPLVNVLLERLLRLLERGRERRGRWARRRSRDGKWTQPASTATPKGRIIPVTNLSFTFWPSMSARPIESRPSSVQ